MNIKHTMEWCVLYTKDKRNKCISGFKTRFLLRKGPICLFIALFVSVPICRVWTILVCVSAYACTVYEIFWAVFVACYRRAVMGLFQASCAIYMVTKSYIDAVDVVYSKYAGSLLRIRRMTFTPNQANLRPVDCELRSLFSGTSFSVRPRSCILFRFMSLKNISP